MGDKVLVLLPTDSNKLLMQWKGPFHVKARVGVCDYRIDMDGREKTFHANLLKEYVSREPNDQHCEPIGEDQSAIPAASLAVVEDCDSEESEAFQNSATGAEKRL